MSSHCQNITALMKSDRTDTQLRKFFRIRCKQWECAYCAKILQRQWRAVIYKAIPEIGNTWSFTTLTMRPYMHTTNHEHNAYLSAKCIKEGWNLFATRLRQAKGNFQYIRVLETHEDSCIHIHLLASIHFDDLEKINEGEEDEYERSKLIKELCDAVSFGYVSHTVNLPIADYSRAVNYVTKYMTKGDYTLIDAIRAHKIRRIQTSRGIKFNTRESENDDIWERIPHVTVFELENWHLYDLDKGKELAIDDFENRLTYPKDLKR